MSSFNYTDNFSGFNDLFNRTGVLEEMADSAKKSIAQLAKTKDGKVGLNDLIKMYQHKTKGTSPAASYAKNMLWLVAMAAQDFITDEQKEVIKRTNMGSSTAFAKAVQEIAPEAVEALYGEEQKSEDLIKFVGDNSILLLRRAIMNMPGDNFIYAGPDVEDKDLDAAVSSQKVEDDIEDVADDMEDRFEKGVLGVVDSEADLKDRISELDFDDVDVSLEELENKDEIAAKIVELINTTDNLTAEVTPIGFNIEGPVGVFVDSGTIANQINRLIAKYFPNAGYIPVRLNTSVGEEDYEQIDDDEYEGPSMANNPGGAPSSYAANEEGGGLTTVEDEESLIGEGIEDLTPAQIEKLRKTVPTLTPEQRKLIEKMFGPDVWDKLKPNVGPEPEPEPEPDHFEIDPNKAPKPGGGVGAPGGSGTPAAPKPTRVDPFHGKRTRRNQAEVDRLRGEVDAGRISLRQASTMYRKFKNPPVADWPEEPKTPIMKRPPRPTGPRYGSGPGGRVELAPESEKEVAAMARRYGWDAEQISKVRREVEGNFPGTNAKKPRPRLFGPKTPKDAGATSQTPRSTTPGKPRRRSVFGPGGGRATYTRRSHKRPAAETQPVKDPRGWATTSTSRGRDSRDPEAMRAADTPSGRVYDPKLTSGYDSGLKPRAEGGSGIPWKGWREGRPNPTPTWSKSKDFGSQARAKGKVPMKTKYGTVWRKPNNPPGRPPKGFTKSQVPASRGYFNVKPDPTTAADAFAARPKPKPTAPKTPATDDHFSLVATSDEENPKQTQLKPGASSYSYTPGTEQQMFRRSARPKTVKRVPSAAYKGGSASKAMRDRPLPASDPRTWPKVPNDRKLGSLSGPGMRFNPKTTMPQFVPELVPDDLRPHPPLKARKGDKPNPNDFVPIQPKPAPAAGDEEFGARGRAAGKVPFNVQHGTVWRKPSNRYGSVAGKVPLDVQHGTVWRKPFAPGARAAGKVPLDVQHGTVWRKPSNPPGHPDAMTQARTDLARKEGFPAAAPAAGDEEDPHLKNLYSGAFKVEEHPDYPEHEAKEELEKDERNMKKKKKRTQGPMLESYQTNTSNYLTEQAASDKRNRKSEVKEQSFKEKYKPKTHWQLEELRRYGL